MGRQGGREAAEARGTAETEERQRLHQRVPLLHHHLALGHVAPREQVDKPLALRLAQHGEEADAVGLRLEEQKGDRGKGDTSDTTISLLGWLRLCGYKTNRRPVETCLPAPWKAAT